MFLNVSHNLLNNISSAVSLTILSANYQFYSIGAYFSAPFSIPGPKSRFQ